ncbi:hypothetical protein M011DRAFT_407995, partial [Sporormia fimetaria CBS 119925]
NTSTTTPAFGAAATNTNTGTGLFGGASNTGTSLFGQQNQQNQAQGQQSGGLFGGFGQNQQNQQKPGGLFGNQPTNTGTSLFGGQPTNPTTTGGGGLFGSNTAQNSTNTGGGLFGNLGTTNTQQNTGTSLFGQSQQKPGGLFGGSTTTGNTGTGLFGSTNQNNNTTGLGGSLFGGQNQQQQPQQQSSLNNSLFGASGASLLQTSMNTNPYGNDALFAGLATPTASPGPLATPLSGSQNNRKSAILPQYKLNPSASTRLLTPQNKRSGYGFSYSTYGSPHSASANASPAGLLGASTFSRSLGRSLSTSNLRNSFTPETSILAPGAFSTTGRSFGSGSLKKLNINRSINTRVPLFDDAPTDRKRVSFAATNGADGETNGVNGSPSQGGELVLRREDGSPDASSSPSTSATMNGELTNGAAKQPEMTQVNGNELASVPENAPAPASKQATTVADPEPGEYYSIPRLDELRRMSRSELTRVEDFTVGRQNIGKIEFNPGNTVDLSSVDLDKVFGDIVQLNMRNATVYGESTTVTKPARGAGLNVPSRITLENSWPRHRAGKKDQKHVERLKRVSGTEFIDYSPQKGEWIFSVPHFSSYGLDYNDGDLYEDEDEGTSGLSPPPDTPTQQSTQLTPDEYVDSSAQSSPDDTFEFQRRRRARVPGGYGNQPVYEEEEAESEEGDDAMDTTGESFLGDRSVGSSDGQHDAESYQPSESGSDQDQDMAGPVSAPAHTTEQTPARGRMPKSILKNSHIILPGLGTPSKGPLVFDDDWANQLQRTISPRKQDRHALREAQDDMLRMHDDDNTVLARSTNDQPMFSRMGLMESLFGEADKGKAPVSRREQHGIELPYAKRPKTSNDLDELSADDRDFHFCNKPHFGDSGTLVYATKGSESLEDGVFPTVHEPVAGAHRDIRFTKLPTFADAAPETLATQKKQTDVSIKDGAPFASIRTGDEPLDFADLAKAVALNTPAGVHEHQAWRLLSILFDEVDEVPSDMSQEHFEQHRDRYRKDKLSEFWESLVHRDADRHAQQAGSAEEKAIACLSGHKVPDACHTLLSGLDLRLATMVAQIGGDLAMRQDMAAQIDDWRRLDVLSEMDEPVRALYELVSGNCARSEGKQLEGHENRARTFCIAQEFGLDWRRAFGLRLWYGILADESIELAVAQYADALRDGLETVKPTPWFLEQEVDHSWKDPDADHREDILWGILKLYASSKLDMPANVEDVLAPENVSGHPLNARLSFQLFQMFKSRHDDADEWADRKVSMPTVRGGGDDEGLNNSFMSSRATSAAKDEQSATPLIDLGDKITLTYAASLHTPELWTTAVYVYAYLSSAAMREHYIRALLAQYSGTYSLTATDRTYTYLTEELKVPIEWMHYAAALEAKSKGDDFHETLHLIKAGQLEEAHEVLCRSVGPDSIISRDYDSLRELLGEFTPTPASSPPKEPVQGWSHGGQIYFDYIHLLDLTNNQSARRLDEELNNEIRDLLLKLQGSLEVVARDRWDACGLEERVALTEISGTVAALLTKNMRNDHARVLKLPLAEDLWLKHSCDLSVSYYTAVMAGGK